MPARRLILLAPIRPARTGNGLAMRSELFRRAARTDFDVTTVVVPVAGELPRGAGTDADDVLVAPDARAARDGARRLLADTTWRERLQRAAPLPSPARAASPGLAQAILARLPDEELAAVHVLRAYLAPLGAAVAEGLGVRVATLDLDEDDSAFAAALGDGETARAYDRLLAAFAGCFRGMCAASAADAESLGARMGRRVAHIPNAVELPSGPASRRAAGNGRAASLLFVGNLSYGPNVEAAELLAGDVLPRVRAALHRPVTLTLVGSPAASLERLVAPGVELRGFVADLRAVYAQADAVVVPLRAGAGTRIKLLEAFAHRVPVVATPLAAAGLDVSHDRHLLLADTSEELAAAVERVIDDRVLASRLVTEAAHLVRGLYSMPTVVELIRAFLQDAVAS